MEIRLQEAVPVSAIPKLIKLADTICTPLPRCNEEAVTGSAIPKLIKLADEICTPLPRCNQEAVTGPTSSPDKRHMAGDNNL